MSKYLPKLVGFKKFHLNFPSEEAGKEFRDFCVEHYVTPQEILSKVGIDYLISRGVLSCQPLPAIDILERLDKVFYSQPTVTPLSPDK